MAKKDIFSYKLEIRLGEAVKREDPTGIKLAIDYGANPNATISWEGTKGIKYENQPVLRYAVVNQNIDVIEAILKGPYIYVDKCTDGSPTALLEAVTMKNIKIVKLLLQHNASVDLKSGVSKRPPLVAATNDGHFDIAQILLQSGAKPDATDKDGYHAMYMAAERGDRKLVEMLIHFGGDPQSPQGGYNYNAIVIARNKGYEDLANWLGNQKRLTWRIAKEIGPKDIYPNTKGLVIFFNYSPLGEEAAKRDTDNIETSFHKIGYTVLTYMNLNALKTSQVLQRIAYHERLWIYDSVVVVISSHGNNDSFFCTFDNQRHDLLEVQENFSSKKCPQLKFKPFVLISDCCRGGNVEAEPKAPNFEEKRLGLDNERRQIVVKGKTRTEVPSLSHMFTVYSSARGILSYGNSAEGSWFINDFCETLDEHPGDEINEIISRTANLSKSKRQRRGGYSRPWISSEPPYGKFLFQIQN